MLGASGAETMKKILVINPKGGCGKTTIATNLASYYALWGVPTGLVDFDAQRSSTEWLAARPAANESIHAMVGGDNLRYPNSLRRVVMDAPARTTAARNHRLLRAADVALIPVLPSAIDIRAASLFLGETLMSGAARGTRIGIIANRVRENTLIYGRLREFLRNIGIPFVTTLRDTQNYVRAAQLGIGIFEMAPSQVEADLEQWRPLINWVEGKRRR